MGLLRLLQLAQGAYRWAVIIIIALLGALLIFRVFNWGLILVSSLAGSMIIVLTLNLQNLLAWAVFGGLCLAGLVVQGLIPRPKKA
jgi:cytochrome c oxidase subunit IV